MNTHRLKRFIGALAAAGTWVALPPNANAQPGTAYPTRPIRLLVPVPPGGSSDGVARIVGAGLTERWGQQVLVDNRPGAAEIIGTDLAAKANPDGYTVEIGRAHV